MATSQSSVKVLNTIGKIKRFNKSTGRHFFEAGAMEFFNSIVYGEVFGDWVNPSPERINIFITSERYDYTTPRLYTVRQIEQDGSIYSLSAFQQYTTKAEAITAIQRFLEHGTPF